MCSNATATAKLQTSRQDKTEEKLSASGVSDGAPDYSETRLLLRLLFVSAAAAAAAMRSQQVMSFPGLVGAVA